MYGYPSGPETRRPDPHVIVLPHGEIIAYMGGAPMSQHTAERVLDVLDVDQTGGGLVRPATLTEVPR